MFSIVPYAGKFGASLGLGADPAVMASPFVATVVDAVSFLVYFLLAHALLGL